MSLETIAIRLDPETRAKLEALARHTGRSRSAIVADAVRLVVDAEFAALQGASGEDGKSDGEGAAVLPEHWNLIV